jgi:hypothetical protein
MSAHQVTTFLFILDLLAITCSASSNRPHLAYALIKALAM